MTENLKSRHNSYFNNGRGGIGILLLSKTKSFVDTEFTNLTQFNVFKFEGDSWYSDAFGRKKVSCQFPVKSAEDISKSVSKLIEDTKKSSVITIPFKQIERMNQMWTEDSTDNIVFNLGKSGLDTISVLKLWCIVFVGDIAQMNWNCISWILKMD